MICHQLDDYLDGELPDAQRQAFSMHAEDCPVCAEAIELDRQMMSRLRLASETLEHPVQVLVVPASQPGTPPRFGRLAVATAVAALLILVALLSIPAQRTRPIQVVQDAPATVLPPPVVRLPAGQAAASIPSGDPNIQILMVFGNQTDATGASPSLPAIDRDIP